MLSPQTPARMAKIEEWLVWADERYEALLSRASETAALSGFDPEPWWTPCECAGRGLCARCQNTGWRKTKKGEGVDRYTLEVAQTKGGFYAQSAGDESPAQTRAASISRLTREIQKLEGNALVRDGQEAVEDSMMGRLRRVSHKPRALRKIERAVAALAARRPELAATLPHGKLALMHLALMVPGRLDAPKLP